MPYQIEVCVCNSHFARLARLQPDPLPEASRPLVSWIPTPRIDPAQSLRSNNSRTGAFTYTPRITGGWPLKDLILADEYKKMRSELDVTLSRLTTTPLQRAQYEALKKDGRRRQRCVVHASGHTERWYDQRTKTGNRLRHRHWFPIGKCRILLTFHAVLISVA